MSKGEKCNSIFRAMKVSCVRTAYIAVAIFRMSESEGEWGLRLNPEIRSQISHAEAKT